MHRVPHLAAILLTLACALAGPLNNSAQAAELKRAALVLQWSAQAQFAGFLAAQAKGFYREAGVDLEIIPGGPDVVASSLLTSGRAQFATMFLATGLERRAQGMPLVHLAQLVQRSALMLITRADSPIREPKDLDGRRVGLWDNEFQLQPRALSKRLGIHPAIIPQSDTLNLFLLGGVDAASGMWYNEYHTLLSSGMDAAQLRVFFYRDLDLNFPEDGLYTLQATLAADPELCRAVARASLKGWDYAFAHPEEAVDLVLEARRRAHLPTNRAHQRFMLARMRDVMLGQQGQSVPPLGTLAREDFDRVAAVLLEQGLIRTKPDFAAFSSEVAR
jgi:NitT/TauT family transport system substrate-binding protein